MHWTLALRHLVVRPGRSLVLLIGYAIGVAVMIVLLSVGDAMLVQSRDVSLVGGGELTVLPEGIDVEALRTGGMTGMYFGIDRARFVTRQMLGGARHAGMVRAVSPILEGKRLVLHARDTSWVVRAGGDLPTVAAVAGAPLALASGTWGNRARDAEWAAPSRQALYDELDRFHIPAAGDSAWGEWHYFNVVVNDNEWWYITLLIGGDVRSERWGGQVLVTRRTSRGHQRFVTNVPRAGVRFDPTRADLTVGSSSVVQRDGSYRVRGSAEGASFDLVITPAVHAYFPAVELRDDRLVSGYVVPALVASAAGQLCAEGRCTPVGGAPAYHDHNWGSWRNVTWEWGTARGRAHALVYGGVLVDDSVGGVGRAPFFLALVDSLGVRQVYRFASVERTGSRPVRDAPGVRAPASLRIVARRGSDTLRVDVRVTDVHATRSGAAGMERVFLQMRGRWTATGAAAGRTVSDTGSGFFETWLGDAATRPRARARRVPGGERADTL